MESQGIDMLVSDLREAQRRMSPGNSHRLLLVNATEAVTQLALRLHDLEIGSRAAVTHVTAWEAMGAQVEAKRAAERAKYDLPEGEELI